LLILLNAHHEPVNFVLPAHRRKVRWQAVFDTQEETIKRRQRLVRGGTEYPLEARSLVLLRLPHPEAGEAKDLETNSV
jgi:isoamylase